MCIRDRAVSVRGAVEELGSGLIPRVFEENPYMAQILSLIHI